MSEFSEDKEKNIIEITTNKEQEAVKPLTPAKLEKFKKAQENTGIIYLSSIPPFMKPSKVKHLLEQFGNIGRVYLAPEDPKTRIRRKKYGGNKKKKYTEGWIEFLDKRIAKTVANTLNTQPIGGNKRNYYHDDLWNIKYLPKFKWTNLTDQIVHEKATRIQRLQAEISQARRENKEYLKKVEKAKMIKSMEEKKEKKRKVAEVEETNLETFTEADTREKKKKKVKDFQSDNKSFEDDDNSEKYSKFKQRKLVISEVIEGRKNDGPTNTSEGVKKILSKIFMK